MYKQKANSGGVSHIAAATMYKQPDHKQLHLLMTTNIANEHVAAWLLARGVIGVTGRVVSLVATVVSTFGESSYLGRGDSTWNWMIECRTGID